MGATAFPESTALHPGYVCSPAVTERMSLSTLVTKRQMIAHRMTAMEGLTLEVNKDA
jgi:hypothetical protein